jgi:diadenosine tetraphosphatase ApaH/serine/threonine PP2A family protein phosphatase
MEQIFELVDKYALVGHTHVPGVFTDEPDFYPPDDLDGQYKLGGEEKAIINPGSVGQPRDLDPRASYIIIDDDCVRFFRLEYDIDAVASKIRATPQLLDWLGERLYEGR